jgi:ligand-binding SRPBCC domain-containing protein
MDFDIRTQNLPDKIYPGMIIGYIVRPLFGIPTKWVTEITHIREKSYFVDEQRVGPYKLWHHQHIILPQKNGVLMRDIVSYQPPFGVLGRIANALIIKNTLNEIFDFRKKALEKIYP